jgi:hypothetical protein
MSNSAYVVFKSLDDFHEVLFLDGTKKLDHAALCKSLIECLESEYKAHCYTDKHIFEEADPDVNNEFRIYYKIKKSATLLFHAYNYRIFRQGDIDSLDELLMVRCDRNFEKYVKFLATLMLSQQFLGIKVAVENYTMSDYWNTFDHSDSMRNSFMNLHIIHFLYQRQFKAKNFYSLYENGDLAEVDKIEQTYVFGHKLTKKFSTILESDHFDEFYEPFFKAWANVSGVSLESLSNTINVSVNHDTIYTNPISKKIQQLVVQEEGDIG